MKAPRIKNKYRYECSADECTNKVVNGGCTNQAKKGGVCKRHGATYTYIKKVCSSEGCTNQIRSEGVCIMHGAKPKRKQRSNEGRTHYSQKMEECAVGMGRHATHIHVKQ